MAEIIFEHVTKSFDGHIALDDVSFEVEKGEFVFIIGKSGAGKSTLLNLITKQLEVTSGSVSVFDTRLETMKKKEVPFYRRHLGIMSQEVGMLKHMTVYDNILLAIRAAEKTEEGQVRILPGFWGLWGLQEKPMLSRRSFRGENRRGCCWQEPWLQNRIY